ncbi:hypothetical protein FACS1894166_08350 [Bacilli bacterium]|nr:hypothetical protein FACS1894166_08350 [Bacilli bacterium]
MKTYLSKLPTKKTYTVADGGVIEIGDKDYTIVLDDNGKVDVDGVKQQLEVDYAVEPLSFKFKLLQIKKSKIK